MKLCFSSSITQALGLEREWGARVQAYDFWEEKYKTKLGALFPSKGLIFSETQELWCVSILLNYTVYLKVGSAAFLEYILNFFFLLMLSLHCKLLFQREALGVFLGR